MSGYKKIKLLKDIIIPAGTIFSPSPEFTRRADDNFFDCTVGLTKNSCGIFDYYVDPSDPKLDEWFEKI